MRFYTYKRQVPLKLGERLGYQRGKGYYAIPAPPAKPVPPVRNPLALYVLFAAQEPLQALHAPAKYTVALSADLAYRDESVAAIKPLHDAGHTVAGWCDCRSDGGTSALEGIQFVRENRLAYFIGQAESPAEFDNAMSVEAPVVVGNITALRQDQIDQIARGDTALIQEDYWCEGWGRAQHPAITAWCAGIYPTPLWAYPEPTIVTYRGAGRWADGDGLYHVAAVTDWQNLP